jgi:hypothetical protein
MMRKRETEMAKITRFKVKMQGSGGIQLVVHLRRIKEQGKKSWQKWRRRRNGKPLNSVAETIPKGREMKTTPFPMAGKANVKDRRECKWKMRLMI